MPKTKKSPGRPPIPAKDRRVTYIVTTEPLTKERIAKYKKHPKQPMGRALDTAMALLDATKAL